jgi:hypothetical protein
LAADFVKGILIHFTTPPCLLLEVGSKMGLKDDDLKTFIREEQCRMRDELRRREVKDNHRKNVREVKDKHWKNVGEFVKNVNFDYSNHVKNINIS